MKKAELIFVPAPGIGHLVAALEFAKRLIDHGDTILIAVIVMKVSYTHFVDAYTSHSQIHSQESKSLNFQSLNPRVYTVGPVLELKGQPNPDLEEDQSQKILKWLDAQPESSVVFLCFGSGGSFGPAQVKEMATGLEQSECKFLWSLRVSQSDNAVSAYNESTSDSTNFPEGFLERIRGRGMICGWAPQVEVLAHKAIGGFVSHCGWNSILESLWYGVPIVTWPLYAEQQLNAFRMVKELGLAVELRLYSMLNGDLVMADEIARAVRCVMDGDSEVRKKVKEMSVISRNSLMEGGSSFNSIGRFIDLNF